MKRIMRVFYNHLAFKHVLMISFNQNSVERIEMHDNVCVLFDLESELVGYNLFNFNSTLLDHTQGFQKMNLNLLKEINIILQKNTLDKLEYDDTNRFLVGEIVKVLDHPSSDHLHLCNVDVGKENYLQIVCGAKNVKAAMRVVVATLGAVLPNGKLISFNKLLGVDSYGMLCSAKELSLKGFENDTGLLELDDHYLIGSPFTDLEVTSC